MTLARSGVTESVEMMMSALLVWTFGIRVAPVVCTNSSSSPRSFARSWAVSTSDPVGLRLASIMPDGGIAKSVAMRIFFAFMISSRRSACAAVVPRATMQLIAIAAAESERFIVCISLVIACGSKPCANKLGEFRSCGRCQDRGRSCLMNLAAMHEHHPVGNSSGKPHLVRDHHHGHAVRSERLNDFQNLAGKLRVEGRGH